MKTWLLALSGLILAGCATGPSINWSEIAVLPGAVPANAKEKSLVRSPVSANPLVENGSAYEFLDLSIPLSVETVIVPDGCAIRREPNRSSARIYLEKSLSYMGHPGSRLSIEGTREQLGLAATIKGNALRLATYGGWSSFEGGEYTEMAVLLPEGVQVRHDKPGQELERSGLEASGWRVLQTWPDAGHGFKDAAIRKNEAN